ncbi:MAG: hypothetical protein GF364_20615 [Candidatus Lokiarchaeota archaeon]|nr:hypothetical protein [Candidatus Lokiarchaeota archaeon]
MTDFSVIFDNTKKKIQQEQFNGGIVIKKENHEVILTDLAEGKGDSITCLNPVLILGSDKREAVKREPPFSISMAEIDFAVAVSNTFINAYEREAGVTDLPFVLAFQHSPCIYYSAPMDDNINIDYRNVFLNEIIKRVVVVYKNAVIILDRIVISDNGTPTGYASINISRKNAKIEVTQESIEFMDNPLYFYAIGAEILK